MDPALSKQITPSFTSGGEGKLFRNTAVALSVIWGLTSVGLMATGVPPLQAVFQPAADAVGYLADGYSTAYNAVMV